MQQEIIDNNISIAKFMGYKSYPLGSWAKPEEVHEKDGGLFSNGWIRRDEDFKYHTSWDWQIPVWRKVNLAVKDSIGKVVSSKPGLYHTQLKSTLTKLYREYHEAVFQNDPLKGQKILVEAINSLNKIKS